MIVEMDLYTLGVSNAELCGFISDEFRRADTDGSGEVDFAEFVVYYNSLQVGTASRSQALYTRPLRALPNLCALPNTIPPSLTHTLHATHYTLHTAGHTA